MPIKSSTTYSKLLIYVNTRSKLVKMKMLTMQHLTGSIENVPLYRDSETYFW